MRPRQVAPGRLALDRSLAVGHDVLEADAAHEVADIFQLEHGIDGQPPVRPFKPPIARGVQSRRIIGDGQLVQPPLPPPLQVGARHLQRPQVLAIQQELIGLQVDRGNVGQVVARGQRLVGLVGVALARNGQMLQAGGDLPGDGALRLAPFQRARGLPRFQFDAPARRRGARGVQRQVIEGVAAGVQRAGSQTDALGLRQDGLGRRPALRGRHVESLGDGIPGVHVQFGQAGVKAQSALRQAGRPPDAQRAARKVGGRALCGVPFEQGVDVIAQAGRQPAPVAGAAVLRRRPLQLQQLRGLGRLAGGRRHVDRHANQVGLGRYVDGAALQVEQPALVGRAAGETRHRCGAAQLRQPGPRQGAVKTQRVRALRQRAVDVGGSAQELRPDALGLHALF